MAHLFKEHLALPKYSKIYFCNHEKYSRGMLFEKGGKGLILVELKFDPSRKIYYYDSISGALSNYIYESDGFSFFFNEEALEPDNGLYPSFDVRKVLRRLKLKPIRKVGLELS